jgi:hypothetical protein
MHTLSWCGPVFMFMRTCKCVHGVEGQGCLPRLDTLLDHHGVQVLGGGGKEVEQCLVCVFLGWGE